MPVFQVLLTPQNNMINGVPKQFNCNYSGHAKVKILSVSFLSANEKMILRLVSDTIKTPFSNEYGNILLSINNDSVVTFSNTPTTFDCFINGSISLGLDSVYIAGNNQNLQALFTYCLVNIDIEPTEF